jgi:hypothetical protein
MIPAKNLAKALLRDISWDSNQNPVEGDHVVTVQFNPESLKLARTNRSASGDQRGGSSIQHVGTGTTTLSFDLWFDETGTPGGDVRDDTEKVVFFITPSDSSCRNESGRRNEFVPPGVRFSWGSFLFEGVMESLNEDLEYFSEDGRPLRAKLAIVLKRQESRYEAGQQQGGSGLGTRAGDNCNRQAREGDSVPDLAGDDWPAVAAANGIEDPLALEPGAILDLGAGTSFGEGLSVGAGAVLSGSLDVGLSAGASFSAGLTAGASASLGGGLRAGVTGGAGLGAGAGLGGGVGGGIGGGGAIGGGVSGGFSAGGGAGLGAGASLTGSAALSGGAGLSGSAMLDTGVGASADFGGAAASASASASASFDRRVRR